MKIGKQCEDGTGEGRLLCPEGSVLLLLLPSSFVQQVYRF